MARQFQAKYQGTCKSPDCPYAQVISVGQSITWSRRGDKGVWHIECAPGYNATSYQNGSTGNASLSSGFAAAKPLLDYAENLASFKKAMSGTSQHVEDNIAYGTEESTMTTAIAPRAEEERKLAYVNNSESDALKAMNALSTAIQRPILNALSAEVAKLKQDVAAIAPKAEIDEAKLIELIKNHAVKRIQVELTDGSAIEIKDLGIQHELFTELLTLCRVRMPNGHRVNVWVSGPAGSGKTQAAENVANALNLPFYFCGAIAEPYSLLGFRDASGNYHRPPFRDAYENGGMFLLDEADSSDPLALMPFNAALANGHCAFPDGVIKRHADCLIVASANTWGHGAKDAYVGRNKLDGAFLDRFLKLPWHVDEKLELAIAGNEAWTKRVWAVRRKVAEKGIKVLVTPRASIYGALLLAQGLPQKRVEELVLQNGMTPEQWTSVC